jgi:hypothetical protein
MENITIFIKEVGGKHGREKINKMAKTEIKSTVSLDLKINMEMTLSEARALHELVVFGTDAFLKVFYENLGKSTLKQQEQGLRSLFDTIRENIPSRIKESEDIIKAVNELK